MIEYLEAELQPSDVLTVAFTGVSHGLGGIHFDFGKSLGQIHCATLLVRDIGCRWYQYENDSPNSPQNVVSRIRETAIKVGAKRIVCLGNSMGGFGSLMFGSLLQADAVLAFVPQTVIEPVGTNAIGDYRWSEYQSKITEFPYGDIAKLPQANNVTICYGADETLDIAHIDRLAWNFKRIATDGHHDAVGKLKERGDLIPLIATVVQG